MMYIDTLADIQRERHAELLREAEALRMLKMLKEAQRANATTGKAEARSEANPFTTVVMMLLALPDRLKTA